MKYKEIVSVTGLGGLFHLLTTKSDGAIVRNIDDKTTKFISARQHHVTPIESIEVYTTGDNVQLMEVFIKMKEFENEFPPIDPKKADTKAIQEYFRNVFPSFDEDRVYMSDMKKILKWYELLKRCDLLQFETEKISDESAELGEETVEADETVIPVDETASEPVAPVEEHKPEEAANTENIETPVAEVKESAE